jgi:hypothetical protein
MDYEKKINERLIRVLSDAELYPYCLDSYAVTLGGIGLSDTKTHAEKVLGILKSDKTLRLKEGEVWAYFRSLSINGENLEKRIDGLVQERREIMCKQINPYLLTEGKTADIGAGNGGFMRIVAAKFPHLELEGWDIVSDDPQGQVKTYDGNKIPQGDGYYSQVYATTVLHHMENPTAGAGEISRLAKDRILLIETIAGRRTGDRTKDWNITFVADYFWRIAHKSGEPVPGSYLTVLEWIELFAQKLKRELIAFQDFGSDQKTMTEKHVLFVFGKTNE